MKAIRTTIVMEKMLAEKVRQKFGGNLSKGINTLLREHLTEKKKEGRMFGALKGRISVKDAEALEREEAEAERNDRLLGG